MNYKQLQKEYDTIEDPEMRELIIQTRLMHETVKTNKKYLSRIKDNVVFWFWLIMIIPILTIIFGVMGGLAFF